jgi:hypothetical protein
METPSEHEAYDELTAYTLTRGYDVFIHQHVVDTFTAQHATPDTKPIAVAFALAGLYLHVERGFTGRQVQDAHRHMACEKRPWPTFVLPDHRGAMTARDVIAVPPGDDRDRAIDVWCAAVWHAFAINREAVAVFLRAYGIV